ncbi:unnamed protein product [Protopolystoma xenopodis]|uniref:mannose-1-phosphate guanylyltransferase n=1 Tax=Protopolystoma xenopodis TaxID=117903 RepID=A0A448WHB9_9PLAT|nr:unnamed protein product [Protopolystoma xenopodis]
MQDMKALILIGGYGTRLRPLTLSVPKPLVEFCNRPMLVHQLEALFEVGITKVILAINREASSLEEYIRGILNTVIQDNPVEVCFSYEDEPLGTAGPLAQAASLINEDEEPFFVLNSDIICNYPFKKMLEFHLQHGHEGTMAVTKVEEPSKYGAVVHNDKTGLIKQFVEKPNEYIANRVNAGLYIFNPAILKRISLRPTSIELETFPQMVSDDELYCIEFSGFWMDVGQPADYLLGMRLYLGYLYESKSQKLTNRSSIIGNVLIVSIFLINSSIFINCLI